MSALLDAILGIGSGVLDTLDMPGSYLRGGLAGRLGDRLSGREMLEEWGALDANEEGLDLGDVSGFGVDLIADPLAIFGLAKGAAKLGKAAMSYADDAVKAPTLGIFGGALGDFSKYGKKARQISPDEATEIYKPWAESLTPEESDAMRLFTSGPQNAISSALRGVPPSRPYSQMTASRLTEAPAINSPERVLSEVVPYADSAIAKTAGLLPEDIVTYRMGGRVGDLTAENAKEMIGEVINDPSYMSTTITPYGRFYGTDVASPGESMLLDILYPKGFPGAFPNAGRLSNYIAEQEILTPRGMNLKVRDVQDVPAATVDLGGYQRNFKLTPDGKPIPIHNANAGGGVLFDKDALNELLLEKDPDHPMFSAGSFTNPKGLDDLLAPGWEEVIARSPKQSFKNVLLEAIDAPNFPAPTTRRLLDEERFEILKRIAPNLRGKMAPHRVSRLDEILRSDNILNTPGLMDMLNHAGGLTSGKLDDLLKSSVPKEDPIGGMLEVLKKVGIPVAGVGAMSPLLDVLLSEEAA